MPPRNASLEAFRSASSPTAASSRPMPSIRLRPQSNAETARINAGSGLLKGRTWSQPSAAAVKSNAAATKAKTIPDGLLGMVSSFVV